MSPCKNPPSRQQQAEQVNQQQKLRRRRKPELTPGSFAHCVRCGTLGYRLSHRGSSKRRTCPQKPILGYAWRMQITNGLQRFWLSSPHRKDKNLIY